MNKDLYKKYFNNKRVTKMGLGPNGRSYGDILFLVRNGASVLVTDYRNGEDLEESKQSLLSELNKEEKSRVYFVFGEHREQDFIDTDYVLKASGVLLDSSYIQTALDAHVPVHTSAAWLFLILNLSGLQVTTIGVTGTKGKSTVTDMIEHIFKETNTPYHVAGNIRGVANLPVLENIKSGEIVLAELDSWQLQGFGGLEISLQISVFTNFFEDHLDYYQGSMELYFKDKSEIYNYQQEQEVCFASEQVINQIEKYQNEIPETIFMVDSDVLPTSVDLQVLGSHNRQNAVFAYHAALEAGIDPDDILDSLETYQAMEGRLKNMGIHKEIIYYDDNNSTTPTSTLLNLEAIKKVHTKSRIIWLGGGADKEFDYTELSENLPNLVAGGILFAGPATDKIMELLNDGMKKKLKVVHSMTEAWKYIKSITKEGDVVILSPGAASFGVFNNEYERGDQFNQYIKNLNK